MVNSTDLMDAIETQVASCGRCSLALESKQGVMGKGPLNARVMFIEEAPGEEEDEANEPFVGRSGKVLTKLLKGIGLDRSEVYITNVVKCRPPDNRDPSKDEVACCREYLDGEIALVKPSVICTLGRWALQTLLEDPKASVTKMNGKPLNFHGMTLVPLLHPAAGLHNPKAQGPTKEGFIELAKVLKGMK